MCSTNPAACFRRLATVFAFLMVTACGAPEEIPSPPDDSVVPMPDDGSGDVPNDGSGDTVPDDGSGDSPDDLEEDLAMCDEHCAEIYGTECAPMDQFLSYFEQDPDFDPSESHPKLLLDNGWPCVEPEPSETTACTGAEGIANTSGWTCRSNEIRDATFGDIEPYEEACYVETPFGSLRFDYTNDREITVHSSGGSSSTCTR